METEIHENAVRERTFPAHTLAAAGLGTAWAAVALAETLLGDLDALDDVEALAAGHANVAAAGLLHTLGGLLLIVGLAGAAPLVWRGLTGRVGWWLTATAAAGLGGIGMLHLLALETSAPGLDAEAMEQFLTERLMAFGAWSVPIVFVALLGPWSLALLLLGLARAQGLPRVGVVVFAAGALVHLLGFGPSWIEYVSHWVMAAGAGYTALPLLGHPQPRPGTTNPDS